MYHFMKVCSAESQASKGDNFFRATEMIHVVVLAEYMEEPLDVCGKSETSYFSISGVDQTFLQLPLRIVFSICMNLK